MSALLSASSPVTDEGLAHATPWALLVIAVLVVVALCWVDRGKPFVADEDEADWAPSIAPDLDDLRRRADRG